MLKINQEELYEGLALTLLNDVVIPTLDENRCINFFVTKVGGFFSLKCNTDWEKNPEKSEIPAIQKARISDKVLEAAVKLMLDNCGVAKKEEINDKTTLYRFEKG